MTGNNISIKEITDALANDEYVYYYQPKVSMLTGKICGAEALMRWKKPDGTMIPPAAFIPVAEANEFINYRSISKRPSPTCPASSCKINGKCGRLSPLPFHLNLLLFLLNLGISHSNYPGFCYHTL